MSENENKSALRSDIPGITWPALPGAAATTRLTALFQLEQSQWWSAEEIREQQFKQIHTLVKHCIENVPFYQERLNPLLDKNIIDEQQWHKIPVLTRDDVQKFSSELCSKNIPVAHGRAGVQRTSGSTGKPIQTLSTEINVFFWNVFTLRDHLWHRRIFNKKLAVIRYTEDERAVLPNGLLSDNWGRATRDVYNTGNCVTLSIFTPVPELVEWLQKEKPYYLLTHPSVLSELAFYCKRMNIELPFLGEVRTISESLPDYLRELCREVLGVPLVDVYSTVELGYLALQCPEHEHYHVQSEGVLLEVLNEKNQPCAPGDFGRVVVTNLHNFAFPLIRYEIGDYAEVGEPCACGRGLPVIKRVLGRFRNMLTMPTGEKRYPRLGIQNLDKIAPIKQFQAVQRSINEIEINVVLSRTMLESEHLALIEKFQNMLGCFYQFTIIQVDKIPRSANGKYEEFISYL